MRARSRVRRLVLGLIALVALPLGGRFLVGQAHAIIGRPLTPMSYAGVARRTTRRAVYVGAATAPYRAYHPYYW